MRHPHPLRLFAPLFAMLFAGTDAQAQESARTGVGGRVLDATTNLGVAGAQVELAAGGDTVRVRSDAAGAWRAALLAGTPYTGRARALGFRAASFDVPTGEAARPRVVALSPLPLALDRLVVTAARREQRLADVVVTTELVSREDLDRSGASDLGSALASATGIQLEGGTPAGTGVMLQGMGSQRVLILLDGQPIPGRIGGEFDVSRIPTSIIERVEVVKGAQSTVYGTDAMGGVVNVITRKAVPGGGLASVSLLAGSRDRRDGSVGLGASLGPVSVRGEAGRRTIATAPGRADERGSLAERTDGSANAEWKASERTNVGLSVLALDERQRWLAGTLYNFGDNVQVTSRLTAEHTRVAGGRLRATAFGSVYDHLSRASAQPQPIRGDTGQRQVQRLFQGELGYSRPVGPHTLDLGLLGRHDDTRSVRIPGGRRGLLTAEPSAQLEAVLSPRVSTTTGVRVSRSERWGTHVTPRLALRLRATDGITVRASAGTGFRAPDFRELYMRFQNPSAGYAVYGNEDLRPERATNYMAGAEWAGRAAFLRVQGFHNEFRGFIEPRIVSAPDQPPVYEYGNVDDGYTSGAEVEGAWTAGRLRVDGGYAFLHARDRTNDVELLGRPAHTARASVSHPLIRGARATLAGQYTARTPMQREGGAITSWRDAYPRVDLFLGRPLTRDVEISLNIENVLDERPAQWAGFTGRQLALSLQWTRPF